ncbi:MAG: potassium channel family protein [Alphaproteobacteria bacterium]
MLFQIALGAGMIGVTTIIQGVFTLFGIDYLRHHLDRYPARTELRATLELGVFVMWLFLATVTEVWAWALLYVGLGAIETLETAVYFSTVTFTTLGFGDITLDEDWRLLSSFEAANGLLMFGWSTALVFAAVQWVYDSLKRGDDA